MSVMEVDSEDDFEQIEVPSDSEAESVPTKSTKRKTLTPPTPNTPASTPYCREKRLVCPHDGCDKAFNRPIRLEEHLRSHENSRIFKCPVEGCDKDYLRDSHLKHHIKSAHTNVRDYRCTHQGCDKSFATSQRLKNHEATHSNPNKYFCQDCDKVFRKKETLQRHILADHQNQKPFPCTHFNTSIGEPCNKSFDTKGKLQQHERQVHDPTRFSCSDCLAFNATIEADVFMNEVEKSTKTKQCFFSTYSELQFHNAVEHPPTCPQCSMPFNTSRELTRHKELVHGIINPNTDVKSRVACHYPDCGKSFSKQGNLNVHIRTAHENRRDFVCGETQVELPKDESYVGCGRDFTSKSALVDHVRSIHLGRESTQVKKRRLRDELQGPKTKKPRSDKGVRKTPAIVDHASNIDRYPFGQMDLDDHELQSQFGDDEQELDGNTTMYGSMLYDPDGAYHYSSGQTTPVDPLSGDVLAPYAEDASSPKQLDPRDCVRLGGFPGTCQFESAYSMFSTGNATPRFAQTTTGDKSPMDYSPQMPNDFTFEPEMSNALDPLMFISTPTGSQLH